MSAGYRRPTRLLADGEGGFKPQKRGQNQVSLIRREREEHNAYHRIVRTVNFVAQDDKRKGFCPTGLCVVAFCERTTLNIKKPLSAITVPCNVVHVKHWVDAAIVAWFIGVGMRIGSLFSGIGGLELGLEWSGIGRTVWQVEQNKHCLDVLARHWPEAERFEDVREVGAHNLQPVDLICGGFPCQDISSAGKRAGLSGARSGLWYEFARVVEEMRPRWVVVENVASGAIKYVDAVRRDLEQLGYASLPVPLSAGDVGAPHARARVFIVGATSDAHGEGQLQPRRFERDVGRRSRDSHRWSHEPSVARVVHGLPGRVDREKALGNSVVPQCAEVIGHVIRQLIG